MAGDRLPGLALLTAPPPTPNGPLHLGHLSGPYVAADVAARAARLRGERVLTLAGLDSHQNYVLTRAEADGRPVDEVHDRYAGLVRAGLAAARIEYDVFLDPRYDPDYRRGVVDLLAELVADKAVPVRDTELLACADCGRTLHHAYVTGRCPGCGEGAGGGTCERCGGFTTAATLLDARCGCCGGPPRPFTAQVPVLRLADYREQLLEVWARAELPRRVLTLLDGLLAAGLPDVVLAYPTDWGIEGPALGAPAGLDLRDDLRVDVWAEMGLGYLYAVARRLDPDARSAADCVAAWREVPALYHFLGIDNAFYYAVLIPALFAAAGMPPGVLRGLVVNEFYRLSGLKFSTSRNHAIWADEFLRTEDPGTVRAYLCWDAPDRYGSDFRPADYAAFRDRVGPLLGSEAAEAAGAAGPAVAPGLPAELLDAEVARADAALRCSGFDAALAVRSLLPAAAAGSAPARALLAAVTGTGPAG